MNSKRILGATGALLALALCQGVNNSNSAGGGGGGTATQGTAAGAAGAWPMYITNGAGSAVDVNGTRLRVQAEAAGNGNVPQDIRADSWGDGASNSVQQLMAYAAMATYNGTGFDRVRSATAAAGTSGTGVMAAGQMLFDGSNWQVAPAGTKTSFVNFAATGSGENQVIALEAGHPIYVTGLYGSFTAAATLTLEYGTGTNCGTATTALSGTYPSVQALALSANNSYWLVPAGNALCVLMGANATGTVEVHYAQ